MKCLNVSLVYHIVIVERNGIPKEGLDYTFRNHKEIIQLKDKNKMKEYIFDLEQTWGLNIDLLNSMIEDNSKFNINEKHECIKNIKKIKAMFEKKKKLFTEKSKIRSKLLMDQQILEEHRRRNEENNAYYQEQIEEYKENIEKKDEFVKNYEKKFNEVEIYVQRQSKLSKNPLYDCLFSFEILPFIYANEDLNIRKKLLNDEIKVIKNDIKDLLMENIELKKRDDNIDVTQDNAITEKNNKIKSLIKLYETKINFLQKNNDQLKNKLSAIKTKVDKISYLNIDLNNKIKDEFSRKEKRKLTSENRIDEEDEEVEKKLDQADYNNQLKEIDHCEDDGCDRKESNYIHNDKKNEMVEPIRDGFNETNYNEFLVNRTNISVIRDCFGDISCIEKNN